MPEACLRHDGRGIMSSTPHGLHSADPRAGAVAAGVGRDQILLGRIAGAHGIRGEVIIHAYTEPPENIAAYGPLTDRSGARVFYIEYRRVTAKGVVARLTG